MIRPRISIVSATTASLILFAFVIAVRAPAFYWAVINWDESIYLLISRSMLEGNVLYTDIWDRKQPLTFGLYALAQFVFGENLIAVRLLGCVAVTATCMGLFFIGRQTFGKSLIGPIVAACLYGFFSVSSGGLATNTEILFAPFTVWAVALMLPWWMHRPSSAWPPMANCIGAGLLIGLATFTKLIAVFDGAFVALLLASGWILRPSGDANRPAIAGMIRPLGAMVFGATIPWLAGAAYFWSAGAFEDFVFANWTFNRLNLVDRPPFSFTNLGLVLERLATTENGLLWVSGALGIVLVIVRPRWLTRDDRRLLAALVVWSLIGLAAAVSLRRLYLHYYLQPTPALALIAGLLFSRLWSMGSRVPTFAKVTIAIALLIPQGLRISERWSQIGTMVDVPAVVAAHISDRTQPGDWIYVANYQPIIYFLTETRCPTRWAFPQFLISPVFRHRLDIGLDQEMASIFSRAPRFVVFNTREKGLVDPDYHRVLFERYLDVDYELEAQIMAIAVFRRSPTSSNPTSNFDLDTNNDGDRSD